MENLVEKLKELVSIVQKGIDRFNDVQESLNKIDFELTSTDAELEELKTAVTSKLTEGFSKEFTETISNVTQTLATQIEANISKIDVIVSLKQYEDSNLEKWKSFESEKVKATLQRSITNHLKGTMNVILNS